MVRIKTPNEIERIKQAAKLWLQAREACWDLIKVNHTPMMLADKVEEIVQAAGGVCTFKNYQGFPGNICVSVNETCIHGIPDHRKFQATDKVGVDLGVSLNGAVCDAGFSKLVDSSKNLSYQELIDHTYKALWAGISVALNGNYTGDIAFAIESYVKTHCPQYAILDDFSGHGCGLHLHEAPSVPNKNMLPKTGTKLVPGMVICIEPILVTTDGTYQIDHHDKWAVKIPGGGQVCHWEHMVLINDDESIVLTATKAEKSKQVILKES